jgi:hypothetical protein
VLHVGMLLGFHVLLVHGAIGRHLRPRRRDQEEYCNQDFH